MAKSAGGFLTLSTLRRWGIQPAAYRYFLLGGHYRKELRFSRAALDQAGIALGRMWRTFAELRAAAADRVADPSGPGMMARRTALREAMADDLNTPRALAELWGTLKDDALAPEERVALAQEADRLLGLRLADGPIGGTTRGVDPARIEAVLAKRDEARAKKDWATADAVRDVLAALGVRVKDAAGGGSTWELED